MIEPKFLRTRLTILLGALGLLFLSSSGRADTYWFETAAPAGYIPVSLHVDFTYEIEGEALQRAKIGRIALNNCIQNSDSTLALPAEYLRHTRHFDLPAALSDSLLNAPLGGTSPGEGVLKAIAEYLVQAGTFEALAVKKTGASGTSTVATYPE